MRRKKGKENKQKKEKRVSFKERLQKKTLFDYFSFLIILLVIWLFGEVVTLFIPLKNNPLANSNKGRFRIELRKEPKSFSDYEKVLVKRVLFKPSFGKGEMETLAHLGTKKMLENLALVGIISAGNTYKALIKDKREKTTSVYKKGDEVLGFTVGEVSSNKVILHYGEQAVELTR